MKIKENQEQIVQKINEDLNFLFSSEKEKERMIKHYFSKSKRKERKMNLK